MVMKTAWLYVGNHKQHYKCMCITLYICVASELRKWLVVNHLCFVVLAQTILAVCSVTSVVY